MLFVWHVPVMLGSITPVTRKREDTTFTYSCLQCYGRGGYETIWQMTTHATSKSVGSW